MIKEKCNLDHDTRCTPDYCVWDDPSAGPVGVKAPKKIRCEQHKFEFNLQTPRDIYGNGGNHFHKMIVNYSIANGQLLIPLDEFKALHCDSRAYSAFMQHLLLNT